MADFPNLSRVDRLGCDTETDGLKFTSRPVGVSVSLPDGADHYFRWGHEMGGNNCTKGEALKWIHGELNRPSLTVYMHNAGFDMRMLTYINSGENPIPLSRVEDTGFMAALLNELEMDLSLDGLGQGKLGMAKEGDELWEFCAETFGGTATRKSQAKNIWRAPGHIVAPYAKGDSRITLGLADYFLPLIDAEGLREVYEMETALIPILLKMHMVGVKVDVPKAIKLQTRLEKELATRRDDWRAEYGDVNFGSTQQLAGLFDRLNIAYRTNPPTEKMLEKGQTEGNPSITAGDLEFLDHPVADQIRTMKKLKHFKGTFINNYILENADEHGLIHGEFHPLRNSRYGTRSGRFSSGGGLNLQNVPARDEEWAPLIRGLYIPLRDDQLWCKADYSQIEYRFLAHYSGGTVMEQYNADPDIDFHQMCADLVGIPRTPAKTINFGLLYGMGVKKLAASLGLGINEAKELMETYHKRLPEIKKLYDRADRRANQKGIIETWGGRFRRFEKQGRRHIHTHKALNALLQGSAADLMKMALIAVADGLDWDETPIHLTVHDELDMSVPRDKQRRDVFFKTLREKMQDYELRVPIKLDIEYGEDWGHAKEIA